MLHFLFAFLTLITLAPAAQAGQVYQPNTGLSKVVYNTDFSDAFVDGMLSNASNLVMADVQHSIGDWAVDNGGEGTFGHVALHAVTGCVMGEALGGGCASGALAGGLQAVYAGTLDGAATTDRQQQNTAELIGAFAGYVTSEGEAAGVTTGAGVARSGMINNRQLHTHEAEFLKEMQEGKTPEEQDRLKAAACYMVQCAAGVPKDDPHYEDLLALQNEGANYTNEQELLSGHTVELDSTRIAGLVVGETTEVALFSYDTFDQFDDYLSSHRGAIDPAAGIISMAAGIAEIFSGAAGAGAICVGGAATVVGASWSCAAGAAFAGIVIPDGYARVVDGAHDVLGQADNTAGQDVLNSFSPDTHHGGNIYYSVDVGADFLYDVVGFAVGAGAGPLMNKVLNDVQLPKAKVDDKDLDQGQFDDGKDGFEDAYDDVPEKVIRRDDDFSSTTTQDGRPKSYLDDEGNLVPSNPDANTTTVSQVRGGTGNNGGSNLTSTTDPEVATVPRDYGDQEISIDTGSLQKDIEAGRVEGVTIRTPEQVRQDLQNNINAAQQRYNDNPTQINQKRLEREQGDLENATRDGECLISGCVPSEYITGPYPTGSQ